jgi:hypothetical protein
MTEELREADAGISLEPYKITTGSNDESAEDASYLNSISTDADADDIENTASGSMTRAQVWNLYTTHILSTWNARTYEFAAVRQSTQKMSDYYVRNNNNGNPDSLHGERISRHAARLVATVCSKCLHPALTPLRSRAAC